MRLAGLVTLTALLLAACGDEEASAPSAGADQPVLAGNATRLDGRAEDLARYRGKVVLVVNTASECGYTPQFKGLEALYRARRDRGLVLLGFPANDFAAQEPRSNEQIAEFCEANYGVTFPMFAKTKVTGDGAHPLFKRLGAPDWNFTKYLLDREGRLVERFETSTEPDAAELVGRIDELL